MDDRCVQKLKYNNEGPIKILRGPQATSKVRIMYLEVKLQKGRHD